MVAEPDAVAAAQGVQPRDWSMRPMRATDVDAVMDVELRAYPFPWTRGIFDDCLRAGYPAWLLHVDGRLAGYGVLSIAAGEAHVLNVCVRPEFRCRGVGRRLLDALLDSARAAGMSDAFLEVRPTNLSAIRLYFSMGFRQVGVRRGYYQAVNGREDAAVLRLELTPSRT